MDLFPIFFIIFIGFIVFMLFSKKGKSLMFGGKILNTIEPTIKGGERKLVNASVKVHVIESSHQHNNIGLEIKQTSGLSYTMMPVTLTVSEAKTLVDNINTAIEQAH